MVGILIFGIFGVPLTLTFGPQTLRPTATRFLGVVGDYPRIGVFFTSRRRNGSRSWLKEFYKVTITVSDKGSAYTVHGW